MHPSIKSFPFEFISSPYFCGDIIGAVSSSDPNFNDDVLSFLQESFLVKAGLVDGSQYCFLDADGPGVKECFEVDGVLLVDTDFGRKVYGVKRGVGKRCAGCKIARFQDEEHQKREWKNHKALCKKLKSLEVVFQ